MCLQCGDDSFVSLDKQILSLYKKKGGGGWGVVREGGERGLS